MKLMPICHSMYKELYEWRSDPFAVRHNPFSKCEFDGFCKTMDQMEKDFKKIYGSHGLKLALTEGESLLALVGLSNINSMMKTAEIGYQVSPKHRNKGIGTYAVKEFICLAFKHTNLRKITASIAAENFPSCKLVEKVGFTQEGLLRQHYLINDLPVDEKIYGILRDELNE